MQLHKHLFSDLYTPLYGVSKCLVTLKSKGQDVSLSDIYMLCSLSRFLRSLTHEWLREVARSMTAHLNKHAEQKHFFNKIILHITPVQMQTDMTLMDKKTRCTITS